MNSVKWLVVGPGDIAQKRAAEALARAKDSCVVGVVYKSRRGLAEALAARFGATDIHGRFEDALERTEANAVYLATPVALHVPQAVAALESGRHVLVEKPLALSAADARPLLDAERRATGKAGCAYYRRFFPRYAHARAMMERNEFGRVVLVRIVYHSWFAPAADDPKRWRLEASRAGGGALADVGSHFFDLLAGLLGPPRTVFAKCDNLVHRDWDVEDSASVLMTLDNGAHVTASVSWNSKTWRQEFEIVGTEARMNWLPGDTGPVTVTRGRETETLELPNASNVHLPLVEDFVRAVQEDRAPAVSVAEAVKANLILDAIYRSAREGCEVAVEEA
jgi:predicted dehydrogenase